MIADDLQGLLDHYRLLQKTVREQAAELANFREASAYRELLARHDKLKDHCHQLHEKNKALQAQLDAVIRRG